MFIAILAGNIVHESIHILQLKGQVSEYCFLGNDGDGAVGWVAPSDQSDPNNENYYLSSGNSNLPDILEYATQKIELFPIIAGYIITLLIATTGLSLIFKKDEKKEPNPLSEMALTG
jgi:hypothetical protein